MNETDRLTQAMAQLDLLTARAKITDLVHRYAHAVRAGETDEFARLFTEDATFEVRETVPGEAKAVCRTRLTGGDAIADYLTRSILASAGLSPLIHNLLIEIDGEAASSRCVMVGAGPTGAPRFIGVYHDSYRRDVDWRFTARVFTMQEGQV